MLVRNQPRSAELPTRRVCAIKNATVSAVAKERHSEIISQILRDRKDTPGHENQRVTTVPRCDARGSLNEVDIEISASIVHPPEVAGAVKITHLLRLARSSDCIHGAEIEHPLAAQLDCFSIGDTEGSRFWSQSVHNSRLDPSTEVWTGSAKCHPFAGMAIARKSVGGGS